MLNGTERNKGQHNRNRTDQTKSPNNCGTEPTDRYDPLWIPASVLLQSRLTVVLHSGFAIDEQLNREIDSNSFVSFHFIALHLI